MPRYFFNVEDGIAIPDFDGKELHDLDAAHSEAVRLGGAFMTDEAAKFWSGGAWRMDVQDEWGIRLFTLHFSSDRPYPPQVHAAPSLHH